MVLCKEIAAGDSVLGDEHKFKDQGIGLKFSSSFFSTRKITHMTVDNQTGSSVKTQQSASYIGISSSSKGNRSQPNGASREERLARIEANAAQTQARRRS